MNCSEDTIPTRESLLSRLKDWSDEKSWREFFEIYWRLIYNTALKAGLSSEESQEVVQETMLTLAKRLPGFRYDPNLGSFKGFLLHTTRWRIRDQWKKQKRAVGASSLVIEKSSEDAVVARMADPTETDLEAIWNDEWEKNLMAAALTRVKRQVNPKHYQLFDLAVIKEWPIEEIVKTMGVTGQQVYTAKSRVGKRVEQELKEIAAKEF